MSSRSRGVTILSGVALCAVLAHSDVRAQAVHDLRFCYQVMHARFVSEQPGGGFVLESRVRFGTTANSEGVAIDVFDPTGAPHTSFMMSERATGGHDGAGGLLVARLIPGSGVVLDASRLPGSGLPAIPSVSVDAAWPVFLGGTAPSTLTIGQSYVSASGQDGRTRLFRRAPDGSSAAGWPAAGRTLFTGFEPLFAGLMVDHEDAAIVFGSLFSGGVVAHRIRADDTVDPSWSTSEILTGPVSEIVGFPSASGHLLAYALDGVSPARYRVLRLATDGTVPASWPANGIDFSDTVPFADGYGGLYGLDRSSGTPRMRHLLADGSEPLGTSGVAVAPAGSGGALGRDDASGLFVAWDESRGGLSRVYVRRLDAAGVTAPGWPDSGVAASLGASGTEARALAVRGDGAGGAMVSGYRFDAACGMACGIQQQASHVAAPGVLDAPPSRPTRALALATLGAHPVRGTLRLSLESTDQADAELTLHDLAGRVLRRASLAGGARQEVVWSLAGIAPGVVLARAAQGGQTVTRRVVVVQ